MMWIILHLKYTVIGAVFVVVNTLSALSQSVLEALVDGTARMPCRVPLHPEDDSVEFIFWYKDDDVTALYTLDARDKSLQEARHVKNETYSHRTHFDVTSDPPYLQIDYLRENDTGKYYCRVDYQWSSTFISNLKLIVVVPPRYLIIRDDSGEEIREIAGPYTENDNVFLTCEAQGGFPPPNITWWKGPQLWDNTFQQYPGGVINDLHIRGLKRSDLLSTFICQAENTKVSSPLTRAVILDLHLFPLTVKITTLTQTLSAGHMAELMCETYGSRPPAKITWWLNHTSLSDNTQAVHDNMTSGILRFLPHPKHNKMTLVCQAQNTRLLNGTIEDRRILNITYAPQVNLYLTNEEIGRTPTEGDYVRLVCDVNANPWILNLGWMFDGLPLFHNQSRDALLSGSSLVLKNLGRHHRGRYRCYAINIEGRGESDEFLLNISHAPICKYGQQITYSIGLSEAVTVRCEVESEPTNVTFQWGFSNTVHQHYNLTYRSEGVVSFARYIPMVPADYGTLYCWAANMIGEQQIPCFFTVVAPAAHPEQSVDCKTDNSTDSSEEERMNKVWKTTVFIAASVTVTVLLVSAACGLCVRRICKDKDHTPMEQILDEEMRMYSRVQCHSDGPPTRILIAKR